MIYDFIANRLKTVEEIGENVFPVGVNIDDIYSANSDFSFTVYAAGSKHQLRAIRRRAN